ncbi:hypothetical protein [Saccharothrix longispora]|uniref:hypothetical protein n=1 Tax=Saccharothrix longispora TaxID=33920 RepID=UPI0028FD51A4|nr:hypothetical protein [Saccharothrix longispora]MDU0289896.1 hypothetical protein [Saccharothrix longispora]
MSGTTWWKRVAVIGFALGVASGVVGTAHARAAGHSVGVRLVEAVSPATTSGKSVTAWCPSGTKLYSAGGAVRDASGQVAIDAVRPLPDLSGVVVSARSFGATSPWVVLARAVCARGNPVLVRPDGFGAAQVAVKEDSVSCAVPGSLTGLGGEVVGSDPADPAALYGLVPDAGLTTATAKAAGPADAPWAVEAWAICDPAKAGLLVREVAKVDMSGSFEQTVTATCADGYQYTGGGASAYGNGTDSLTVAVAWLPDPDSGTMTAIGTKGASPWGIEAYAICSKG